MHPKFDHVRLIVSDVDGTLLDRESRVPVHAAAAIQRVRQRGIRFTLATGRSWPALGPLIHYLDLEEPVIVAGGGQLVEPLEGKVLQSSSFSTGEFTALVELARSFGLGITCFTGQRVYAEGSDLFWMHLQRLGRLNVPEPTPSQRFQRVHDLLAEVSEPPVKVDLHGFEPCTNEVLEQLHARLPQIDICMFQGRIEITARGANKGTRLKALADLLDIPLAKILVIGDAINDIPLFEAAGFSIAMGNACLPLKVCASAVAPPNDRGGFAWALKRFVLNEIQGEGCE